MVSHPSHPMLQPFFVSSLGGEVQPVVRPNEYVQPARVAGIRVEDVPRSILIKHAGAGSFLAWELLHGVVVIHLPLLQLLLRHRALVVIIEIPSVRLNPMEPPAHALL